MIRPFYSVGLLYRRKGTSLANFLGSCCAFRTTSHFLTAVHCIGMLEADDLAVAVPAFSGGEALAVREVVRHPSGDLAVLVTDDRAANAIHPFSNVDLITDWGEEIGALGFPEDSHPDNSVRPTVRLFRGFAQRFFKYDESGWQYGAVELSFGAPAGLSGGPVFPMRDVCSLSGIATANRDATTYLASVAEVQDGNSTYTEKIHHRIQYGIALDLKPWIDWLTEIVPRRPA